MANFQKAHVVQNSRDCHVPVMWDVAWAVEVFLEEPVIVWFRVGISLTGVDDVDFIVGQGCIPKGVFAVPLFENTALLNDTRGEKTQGIRCKDRCIMVAF